MQQGVIYKSDYGKIVNEFALVIPESRDYRGISGIYTNKVLYLYRFQLGGWNDIRIFALVAQMAERVFGKDEVSGPIPDEGSKVVNIEIYNAKPSENLSQEELKQLWENGTAILRREGRLIKNNQSSFLKAEIESTSSNNKIQLTISTNEFRLNLDDTVIKDIPRSIAESLKHEVRILDFKDGENGHGMIVIKTKEAKYIGRIYEDHQLRPAETRDRTKLGV